MVNGRYEDEDEGGGGEEGVAEGSVGDDELDAVGRIEEGMEKGIVAIRSSEDSGARCIRDERTGMRSRII